MLNNKNDFVFLLFEKEKKSKILNTEESST